MNFFSKYTQYRYSEIRGDDDNDHRLDDGFVFCVLLYVVILLLFVMIFFMII